MSGEPINEAAIRHTVEQLGFDWDYRQHTESTNADVLQHYEDRKREVVAVSESQSAGRGRRGRLWMSPFARNIYCTIGIVKAIPGDRQGLISIVTGVALCRALQQTANTTVNLKWPNDLLFEGRKLGGILIESRPLDSERIFFAVGFGLNIFMHRHQLADISQPATSLDRIAPGELDRTQVLAASIDRVIRSIRSFDRSAVQELIRDFAQFDAFHDCPIEVISGQDRITGINRGITTSGQLQLETEHGMQIHSAAEISLRTVTK